MADTTAVAAISAIAALGGGLIGAGAGHFTTIRSQKAQHDEDHYRHRQGVYHDFLDHADLFMQASGGHTTKWSDDEWGEWFRTFEHHRNAIELFATERARDAAKALSDEFGEVMSATRSQVGETMEEIRRNAYESREDEVLEAWADLVEAMRADVGPDA